MKEFFSHVRGAIMATVILVIVCCGLYPLIVFGISQALFHDQATGSLIIDPDGTARGSRLLGQNFTDAKYFHPRPSAAGNGYDASSSGGSNLGPTSQKLNDAIKDRIDAYRKENGLKESEPVPADAVTASGSGLDPHISPEAARWQVPRVAKARGRAAADVQALVDQLTQGRTLGFLGEPTVNVLRLNLTLDRQLGAPAAPPAAPAAKP